MVASMHQHPRRSPATSASPIQSPAQRPRSSVDIDRNDPSISEDQDVPARAAGRTRDTPVETPSPLQEPASQVNDGLAKLNQIVQNYFTKAALIVLSNRVPLPPAYAKDTRAQRVNKWFNVEVDETEVTREALATWKTSDAMAERPPPLVIELYIDTGDLTTNQSLVFIDDVGRKWDVDEALNASPGSSAGCGTEASRTELLLERWIIQLGNNSADSLPTNLASLLPRIYKNSIVLFRSLYAYSKLLPAYRISKRSFAARSATNLPRLKYRIATEPQLDHRTRRDNLMTPLFNGHDDVVETFAFDPIESPAGPFSIHVTYRSSCDLQLDDHETFLSSRFMGMDEPFPPRPLPQRHESAPGRGAGVLDEKESSSLPRDLRTTRPSLADQAQAYGSLSTFHNLGPAPGTSPLSALRAAQYRTSESPEDAAPQQKAFAQPATPRSKQGSRSSLRSTVDNAGAPSTAVRRPSVTFTPFKTPSLSASPSQIEQTLGAVPRSSSLGKSSPLALLAEARHPSGPVPVRTGSGGIATDPPRSPTSTSVGARQASSANTPTARYSSSFGHRKAKLSGGSRTEDDNSSGKASDSSAAAPQPDSGLLAEGGTSSGSIQTEDDNISEFLKLLDQKKDLKSFRASSYDQAKLDATTKRTTAALSKFQKMRESNIALSESLSSSYMLQRSSSSSSRQLGSVPQMVAAGTSLSTSSSPGKPISPHTPHTPAIPSRLSANSVPEQASSGLRRSRRPPFDRSSPSETRKSIEEEHEGDDDEDDTAPPPSGAIDIPASPRAFHSSYRRSSSAAQQGHRAIPSDDDDIFPFVMRSASLGVEDRPISSRSGAATSLNTKTVTTHAHPATTAPSSTGPSRAGASAFAYRASGSGSSSLDNQYLHHLSRPSQGSLRGKPSNISSSSQEQGPEFLPRRSSSQDQPKSSPQHGTQQGQSYVQQRNTLQARQHRLSSASSAGGSSTTAAAAAGGTRRAGSSRYSFSSHRTSTVEDDEPLLFAMSDFDTAQVSAQVGAHGVGSAAHGGQQGGHHQGQADEAQRAQETRPGT